MHALAVFRVYRTVDNSPALPYLSSTKLSRGKISLALNVVGFPDLNRMVASIVARHPFFHPNNFCLQPLPALVQEPVSESAPVSSLLTSEDNTRGMIPTLSVSCLRHSRQQFSSALLAIA